MTTDLKNLYETLIDQLVIDNIVNETEIEAEEQANLSKLNFLKNIFK